MKYNMQQTYMQCTSKGIKWPPLASLAAQERATPSEYVQFLVAGHCQTKRDNAIVQTEDFLMFRTLREMNLSKMVAQDVPLLLSLVQDLFPNTPSPPKGEYLALEAALKPTV